MYPSTRLVSLLEELNKMPEESPQQCLAYLQEAYAQQNVAQMSI